MCFLVDFVLACSDSEARLLALEVAVLIIFEDIGSSEYEVEL